MRIAWVTPSPPHPPDEGARVVALNRISGLDDRGHELYVLAPVDERDPEREMRMEDFCTDATYVQRNGALGSQLRRPWTPHLTARARSERLEDRLSELEDVGLDAVFVEYTPMAEYVRDRSVPTCVGVHNVEHRLLAGMARDLLPSPVAAAYAVEAARLHRYERALYRRGWADGYAFLSTDDRDEIVDRYPNVAGRAFTAPVGVDLERFAGVGRPEGDGADQRIVFTGSMSYRPNVDAARWFVGDVFPLVREEHPAVEFFVVGKDPAPAVTELGDRRGVTVTGRVDQIEPYVAGADAVVVPLQRGGGVKIKLLEALAAGSPVVTTSVGVEGTAVRGGEHVFLADDAPTFAEHVRAVLDDPDREGIREAGHRFVRDRYSQEVVVDRLEDTLRTIADRR